LPVTQIENGYPKSLGQLNFDLSFPDITETDELMISIGEERLLLQPGRSHPKYANILAWAWNRSNELIIELPAEGLTGDSFSICIKSFEGGTRSWILKGSDDPSETWFNTGARLSPGSLTSVLKLGFANDTWTVEAEETPLDLSPAPIYHDISTSSVVEPAKNSEHGLVQESFSEEPSTITPGLESQEGLVRQFKLPEQLRDASKSARDFNLAGSVSHFDLIIDIASKMNSNLDRPERLLKIIKAVQALSATVSPRPISLSMGAQFKVKISPSEDAEDALKEAIARARSEDHQNGDSLEALLPSYLDSVQPQTAVLVVGYSIPYFVVEEVTSMLEKESKQLRFLLIEEPAVNVNIGNSPRLLWDLVDSDSVPVISKLTRFI
jgi:hypothetical protein